MAQVCCGCGGKVFPAEKLVLNGKTFHRGGCAKCGMCGASLTIKNLVSVSSEDKSKWCCNAHGVATVNKAGGYAASELRNESTTTLREGYSSSNNNAIERSKKRSSAANRFASFLRKAVHDEESKRFGAISSMIRSSIRKQVTKEALTAITTEKQSELAAFVEEIRQQEVDNTSSFVSPNTSMRAFPSNSTMASTASGVSTENTGSRMNRFVRSLRLNKPSTAKPSPPSGPPPPPTKSGFGSTPFGKNRFVSVSLKNVHVQDKRNKFQRN